VVNIAASRSMTTTAEGVETESQCEALRQLSCTEIQGWIQPGKTGGRGQAAPGYAAKTV